MGLKRILIFVFFVLMLLVMVSAKPPKTNACPISSNHNIVVYGDTGFGGVGDLSKSWIQHFFDWWKTQDSRVSYVFVDGSDVSNDCNLSSLTNVKLYVQPGGNAYYQQKTLGESGKQNILNHISSGKAYLGICAGFFYASNDYYWQGSYYDWPYMLDIFPSVEGSITNIADYDQNPGYALTRLSNGHDAIYYGGPTQGWRDTQVNLNGGNMLASFASIPGDLPALVKYDNMLLTSVHLEAYENDGISGLSTEDRIENYKLLANNINDVSGTNFFVPAYNNQSTVFACSDGIDNDADGYVDLNDIGCESEDDNDEYNYVPPVNDTNSTGILFEDGFENGLGNWITSAVSGGSVWNVQSDNPYDGIYYAFSKPMSTTQPASILESKSINTSSANTLKISYARKLVGLDSADEFSVKYYDGIWHTIEMTGSSGVSDSSYKYKEYLISTSSEIKLRFECTAGAVSESCRVDSVKVEAI
jgi:glutamine amidotransferase-like uncharacterized protein